MGSAQAYHSSTATPPGWSQRPIARSSAYPQRTSLNLADWGAMEDLPPRYPPYHTCHHRFQYWVGSGVFARVLQGLATDLRQRGQLGLSE
jgi:hypothetical protein